MHQQTFTTLNLGMQSMLLRALRDHGCITALEAGWGGWRVHAQFPDPEDAQAFIDAFQRTHGVELIEPGRVQHAVAEINSARRNAIDATEHYSAVLARHGLTDNRNLSEQARYTLQETSPVIL